MLGILETHVLMKKGDKCHCMVSHTVWLPALVALEIGLYALPIELWDDYEHS
jgi:hypothetical protein